MTRRILMAALLFALGLVPTQAASFHDGVAALGRHDDAAAARILPQSYVEAAYWCRSASEQGNPTAQYMLGLMYDKGQGLPLDYVLAYKWLNLAVAQARGRERQDWVRIRDAVAGKLSLVERTEGQRLAVEWQPSRGR
jgi:hypothetical protein